MAGLDSAITDENNRAVRPRFQAFAALGVALLFLGLAAWAGEAKESTPAADTTKRKQARLERRGEKVYREYCAGCHGVKGDGKGPAAALLSIPPRDFTSGEFKFSSRRTPELPTDDDLMQVVRDGLRGTAMSSFREVSEDDRLAVVQYLKTFSRRWIEDQPTAVIAFTEDPFASDPARGVAEGDKTYHAFAMCFTCHPAYHTGDEIAKMTKDAGFEPGALRPGANFAVPQPNPDGTQIYPPDFTRDWVKTGPDVRNLYRVISAGITTTAMPTWIDTLTPEQLWGLAHYVHSLAEKRPFRFSRTYVPRPPFEQRKPLTLKQDSATSRSLNEILPRLDAGAKSVSDAAAGNTTESKTP